MSKHSRDNASNYEIVTIEMRNRLLCIMMLLRCPPKEMPRVDSFIMSLRFFHTILTRACLKSVGLYNA